MIVRGIGYVVAGQNSDSNPEKDQPETAIKAGSLAGLVRCLKGMVARLIRRPATSAGDIRSS